MTSVTTPSTSTPPNDRSARVTFALQQAALLGAALLVAGFVTERLRPHEATDRGIVSTQFLWAIVVWAVVLLVNAVVFEQSQMRVLERTPLLCAGAIGVALLLLGLVSFDAGPVGRRIVYLIANSIGAAMFWWATISLGWLITHWVSDSDPSSR